MSSIERCIVDLRVDGNKEATNKITLTRCSFEFLKTIISTISTYLSLTISENYCLISENYSAIRYRVVFRINYLRRKCFTFIKDKK